MKGLRVFVSVKRVVDYAVKVRIRPDGKGGKRDDQAMTRMLDVTN